MFFMTVMSKDTQISAQISDTTRKLLERHVRRTGIKKGHLVEQALLHHLQALDARKPALKPRSARVSAKGDSDRRR